MSRAFALIILVGAIATVKAAETSGTVLTTANGLNTQYLGGFAPAGGLHPAYTGTFGATGIPLGYHTGALAGHSHPHHHGVAPYPYPTGLGYNEALAHSHYPGFNGVGAFNPYYGGGGLVGNGLVGHQGLLAGKGFYSHSYHNRFLPGHGLYQPGNGLVAHNGLVAGSGILAGNAPLVPVPATGGLVQGYYQKK